MGGGSIHGNPDAIKENDEDLKNRIRPIEFIKHNPQLFHLNFFSLSNQWEIAGGFKTCCLSLLGGTLALSYFFAARTHRPYNFYIDTHMGFLRFFFGASLGGAAGYLKFGDR